MALAAHLAILPSTQEMFILLIVGLLLFGRRLPEVGKQVGRVIVQLRQGIQKLKDEIELEEQVRDVQSTVSDVRDDLERSIDLPDAPRVLADPHRMLEDLTDEALASPGPDEAEQMDPSAPSLFVQEAQLEAEQGDEQKLEES